MSDDDNFYGEDPLYEDDAGDNGERFGQDDRERSDRYEMEEQQFGVTYADTQRTQVAGEELNARSQKDKPFILLRDELMKLGLESKYIDDTIKELRDSTLFPFLNGVYVANVKYFMTSGQKTTPESIKKWVTEANKQFGDDYLDLVDFYRYIKIGEKLFNQK